MFALLESSPSAVCNCEALCNPRLASSNYFLRQENVDTALILHSQSVSQPTPYSHLLSAVICSLQQPENNCVSTCDVMS